MAVAPVRFGRAAAALVLATCLAACGNGAGLSALVGAAGNQGIDLDSVPRSKIEAFGNPILRATVPARGSDFLLSVRDTRGSVTTWEAAEGVTFAFRDGLLIESRGLGADLMSAQAPAPAQLLRGGPYPKTYFFAGEDDQTQRRDYTCTTETVGPEAVTIYGKTHATRHLRETCLRDVGRITNDFWFEAGTLRMSRQWLGPDAGYAEFRRVVD